MFAESNFKLRQVQDLLVELIAEIDVTLEKIQASPRAQPVQNGDGRGGESDSLSRIIDQREVLMSVAIMLADVRFDWREEPQHLHDGKV
jgi:hypothetical protein